MAITPIYLYLLSLNNTKYSSIQNHSIPDKASLQNRIFLPFSKTSLQKMDGLQKVADDATLQLATGQIQGCT